MSLTKKYIMQTDDKMEAKRAMKSLDLCIALWDYIHDDLRSKIKHGHNFKTVEDALEWAREALCNRLEEAGVDLDNLME